MKKAFIGILVAVWVVRAYSSPNIVFIMADDLGFSDLGCYGGEAATPNLDRLAQQGVRFSQFYNCGKCEPTRAALMSGHRNTPLIGFYAERAKTFLPAVLKADGYRTLMAGKWHVSRNPLDRGFDRFYGLEEGACNYWTGSGQIRLGYDLVDVPNDFYSTDAFTDYALKFLDDAETENDDRPFFLYLAYNAPHDPLQAPEEEIAKYRGRYLEGWHSVKHRRMQKVRELGLVPKNTRRTDWPQNLPRWDSLSEDQKKTEDLRMATYTAMIDRMDQNIGRVFQWLEKHGETENTLIIFVSDNGANPFDRDGERMVKAGILPGGPDSRWDLGTAWAHVCNTPFRMYKRNQHEGGICAPMIAAGPGLNYPAGSVCQLPVHVLDFLPTFHVLAGGADRPEDIEGTDLSKVWKTGEQTRDFEMAGCMVDHRYIRRNDWKMVSVDGQPWELFNLADDRSETRDLVLQYPEKAQELETAWDTWYGGFSKTPFIDPDESPRKKKNRESAHMGDKGSGANYKPVAAGM
jgi:arylsulfatase